VQRSCPERVPTRQPEQCAIANPTPPEALPPHVAESARAVEELQIEHHVRATSLERTLDGLKERASMPSFIVAVTVLVAVWIVVNGTGLTAWDPPPFIYLEIVLSSLAFLMTILILATQRRADTLAAHREQLILQLAFVSEQKTAKVIGLLEELRRDSPHLRDRVDTVAEQMTESVDPHAVSEALRGTTEGGAPAARDQQR
jgi:uncharacterized membrane protein